VDFSRSVVEFPAPCTSFEDCHVISSGPSGSPENTDALPSRRALRAQREAAEAAEARAAQESPNGTETGGAEALDSVASPADSVENTSLATAVLPIIPTRTEEVPLPGQAASSNQTAAATQAAGSASTALSALGQQIVSSQAAHPGQRDRSRRGASAVKPRASKPQPHALRSQSRPNAQPVKPEPLKSKPKPPRRRRGARSPLTVVVAIAAIPGLFLTAGLPAYAFVPQTDSTSTITAHAKTRSDAQVLIVADAAAHTVVSRDGFSATSAEQVALLSAELRREGAAAAARASAAQFAISGIRAEGDDYPWPYEATDAEGGGLSPLGYYYRECVDFVAWRLNRDAGIGGSPWKWTWSKMTPNNGDASGWADAWASKGWTTSKTPVVGSVAWFTYNHVAYVQSVPGDGTVVLEEYNWMGMHSYHTRTVSIGEVPLYLYPPG
jgi:hypothetical protein